MNHLLKQSTAVTVLVGPVLDSAGAAYTGMAIGDFNITKNGTTAAMAASATATHSHNGMYLIAMTTGNTDTLNALEISCNKATYAMSVFNYTVLTASTYDALITNAANAAGGLQDIQRVGGTVQTAGDLAALATAIKTKTDFHPSATAGAAGGLMIAGSNAASTFATFTITGAFTINGTNNVAQSGDSFNRIGALGAGLTALAPSATALSTATWTATRAGYIDNLNGSVAQSGDGYAVLLQVVNGELPVYALTDAGDAIATAAALATAQAMLSAQLHTVQNAFGTFAATINGLTDPRPDPRTFAFHYWVRDRLRQRIAYCNVARATTYYFSQSGNDSTGTGAIGAPFKTTAKAQTIINASSGDIAVLFKRGDTWTETVSLSTNAKPNITIGAYGDVRAPKPIFDGGNTNTDGIVLDADGCMAVGLNSKNWGSAVASPYYCIKTVMTGTRIGLVMDCDAYNANTHVFGQIHPGGSGGIIVFLRCRGGGLTNVLGTVFVSYARDGGNEGFCVDCEITQGLISGAPASTGGFIMHTNTGVISQGYCINLLVRGGANCVATPASCGNFSAITTPASCSFFEIGTIALGGIPSIGCGGAQINCMSQTTPPSGQATGSYGSIGQGWVINSRFEIDLSLQGTNTTTGLVNGFPFGVNHARLLHSHVHWKNKPATLITGFEAQAAGGSGTYSNGKFTALNSIFSGDGVSTGYKIGMIGAALVDGNAYYGIDDDTSVNGAYSDDANAILLSVEPAIRGAPIVGDPMYHTAQELSDGIALEYDAVMSVRSLTTPNVGPIEPSPTGETIATTIAVLSSDVSDMHVDQATGFSAIQVKTDQMTFTVPNSIDATSDVDASEIAAEINVPTAEENAAAVLAGLGSNVIEVTSPVDENGEVEIWQGDDYLEDDLRQITFTNSDYSGPSLVDGVAHLDLYSRRGVDRSAIDADFTFEGEISVSGDVVTFKFSLDAEDTAAIAADMWHYRLWATTVGESVVTQQSGTFRVK